MRSGRTTKVLAGVAAMALAGGAAKAESACVWRVAPLAQAPAWTLPLPPLATVTDDDASGQSWRQAGEIGGSVASAGREFRMALGAAGWKLDKAVAMGRGPRRSELMIWTRQTCRVLFMVWEKETGTCGFAWGEER